MEKKSDEEQKAEEQPTSQPAQQDSSASASHQQHNPTVVATPVGIVVGQPVGVEYRTQPGPYYYQEPRMREGIRYCGPKSCLLATLLAIFFWPAALFVPLCPCDEM